MAVGDGDVRIEHFETRRSALILAKLALAPSRICTRDEMAELLWPDDYLDATRNRLRQELARLRRVLGDAGEIFEATRESLKLNLEVASTDVQEYESVVRSALQVADPDERLARLQKGVQLYKGSLLPGYAEDWIVSDRQRLRNTQQEAMFAMAGALAELGRFDPAVEVATSALSLDSTRELAHVARVRILAEADRVPEAVQAYRDLEQMLQDEFGVAPSASAQELGKKLQAGDWTPARAKLQRTPREEIKPNVPVPMSPIHGRDTEVEKLCQILDPTNPAPRLVTLIGPGGIGKTRLGVEIAQRMSRAFNGNVWYAPLADLSAPDRLILRILDDLGIDHPGDRDPMDLLVGALPSAPSLLVLDNFEQLVDGGAWFLKLLLERKAGVRLLVTSRQKLNLEGEQEFSVTPLELPEDDAISLGDVPSVLLFTEVAKGFQPDFTLVEEDAPSMIALMRRLEGIPLAITLAAARAHLLTVDQMLSQLDDRFSFLVSRRIDLPERHRALRATIEWSYRLLEPGLQQFFLKLCVFRGGWTVSTAADICSDKSSLEYIELLRANSLIVVQSGGRFRMLETVREFAEEEIPADIRAEVSGRHADYFEDFIKKANPYLVTQEQSRWYRIIAEEHDNLRAAIDWTLVHDAFQSLRLCGHMWRFWTAQGHQTEARQRFEAVLKLPVAETDESYAARANCLFGAALMAQDQSEYKSAGEYYHLAMEAHKQAGNKFGVGHVLLNLAEMKVWQGQYGEASDLARAAGESPIVNFAPNQVIINCTLSTACLVNGNGEEALELLREAVSLQSEDGDPFTIAFAYHHLGVAHYELGNLEGAEAMVQKALDIYRSVYDVKSIAYSLRMMSVIALATGDIDAADEHLKEAAPLLRKVGGQTAYALNLLGRSKVALARQDLATAETFLLDAMKVARKIDDPATFAACIRNMARIRLAEGHLTIAKSLLLTSEAMRKEHGVGLMPSQHRDLEDLLKLVADVKAWENPNLSFDAIFTLAQDVSKFVTLADSPVTAV